MNWSPDWGLRARMFAALWLVCAAYVAVVAPIFLHSLRAGLAVAAALVTLLFALASVGHRYALYVTNAVRIGREDLPELHATLSRLCRQADLPTPDIGVVPGDDLNAFTVGSGSNTVVCVTKGLWETLPPAEREAVLAHELAHVKNRDSLVMTVIAFPLTVALFLLVVSGSALESTADTGFHGFAIGLGALSFALPLLLVSYPLVHLLSHYREYAADRGAVAITGQPSALASALRRIDGASHAERPTRDLRSLAPVSAFCIVPPRGAALSPGGLHPSTERRIARLRELEREIETP